MTRTQPANFNQFDVGVDGKNDKKKNFFSQQYMSEKSADLKKVRIPVDCFF